MPVAVVKKKPTNQQSDKQTKIILSIKSHSFPTFSFYFIHFFSNFLLFYNSNKSNNNNNNNNNNNK